MPDTLDIQKVISTSTSNVSLDDLTKKGFKQVKVLNQAIIQKLIGEAVDRVLSERSKEISKEERDKVIKEARTQFETLARKRLEKERSRIDELESANHSLTAEVDTLKKRLAASMELQASRDQAVARAEALEADLATKTAAISANRKQADEVVSLRQALSEEQKRASLLEGQLTAKNDELERAKGGAANESTMEKLLEVVQTRLGKGAPQGAEMSQLMLTLDGLSRRIANLGSGGGGGGGGGGADAEITSEFMLGALFDKEKEGAIVSNVQNVKVKESKATGVKGALAKLKKLQQGGADGE